MQHRSSIRLERRACAGLLLICALWALPFGQSQAAETRVAVAANFTDAAKEIAQLFEQKTHHTTVLSFGSSGQLYTQIAQGAPFELLLSADGERPQQAIEAGLAIAGTRFTYALGKLVLWSKDLALVQGKATLESARFQKLAIASPELAPYGAAAIEVMKALGVYAALEPKLVRGNNITQTFQFIDTGNAELGFIALSQLTGTSAGSRWVVPRALYTPIRQDAVLLKLGAESVAARAFLGFLQGAEARAVIERHGYALDGHS